MHGATSDPLFNLLAAAFMIKACANCKAEVADAKFVPCRHKVVCEQCSIRFGRCPQCRSPVQARHDDGEYKDVLQLQKETFLVNISLN